MHSRPLLQGAGLTGLHALSGCHTAKARTAAPAPAAGAAHAHGLPPPREGNEASAGQPPATEAACTGAMG